MNPEPPVPETSVLAVASHVVSGNVGNKVAVFVLQSMGCEVSALNTVHFKCAGLTMSQHEGNHMGYRQVKGTRTTAQEITELWEGLKQSYLDDFDVMLSGYVPGAAGVEAVGNIGKELKASSEKKPGSFFWVLDPVMGDNGRIYVAEDVVPAYQSLVHHADLILPNQFEAELLSGVKITDSASLERAVEVLHEKFNIPHIVITSVSLPLSPSQVPSIASSRAQSPAPAQPQSQPLRTMSVVGSTRTSDRRPRLFKIHFPVYDWYFSGTGDMFAALMVVRMREAVHNNNNKGGTKLEHTASWLSPDDVDVLDLPLARAAEKVLASMHEVLARTSESLPGKMQDAVARHRLRKGLGPDDEIDDKTMHLLRCRTTELKLSRDLPCLRDPTVEYRAERM
ncbi:Ribokinase-like protein [Biscogniauxia sp. FL1348]|nr:Ribokinase-like protein [Biscogniauxia sp. FL1348]